MREMKFLIIVLVFGATMGVMLPVYNIFVLQPSIFNALIENTEQDAVNAARHLARELFPQQAEPIEQQLSPTQRESIDRLMDYFKFFKIKVFSPQGRTVFSTHAEDIDKVNDKEYFHQEVAKGLTVTKVVQKSQPTLDGPVISRDVVETYVPILVEGGFAGAFEIYYDITEDKQTLKTVIDHSSIFLLLVTIVFLVLLTAIAIKGRQAFARQMLAEQEIRQLAYFDNLTGLPNRSLFQDRLTQALSRARRDGTKVALLYFDLDRFKEVNDTFGHHTGDLLLQGVAQRLQRLVRQSDTLARIGGDEFAHLVTSLNQDHGAAVLAERILEAVKPPFELEGKKVFTSPSIGIAIFPSNGGDAETLQKHADIAMYVAKEHGRNTFAFFSEEMNRQALERREMENALRQALAHQEFFLAYQPQLDLRSGRVVGAEALLRWNHPEKGLVSPAQFIPLAEETGLIGPLGEWVLRTACSQNKAWQEAGHPPMRMAVNLSAYQLRQHDFVERLDRVLQETGLDPWWLELELTESLVMENAESSKEVLAEISRRGIHLAIDDFGTGYSSLSYLKHFTVDRIKIDRSFVGQLPLDLNDSAIVETILAMAKTLKLEVVAEGVETQEQLDFLQFRECHGVQGFYLGRPMAAEAFVDQLEKFAGQVRPAPIGQPGQEMRTLVL